MTRKTTFFKSLAGATALSVIFSGTAFAGGTSAGTNVTNTFTLDYQVSGVDQPQITNDGAPGNDAPTAFTVDRLVDLTVALTSNETVAPGAQDQELVFSVTNDGNDTHAYALSIVNESGDEFSATGTTLFYYIDDGDGIFEPGGDDAAAVAYNGSSTPDLAPDATLWVAIQGDIPSTGVSDGDTDVLSLVADTLDAGTTTATTGDSDGNTMTGTAENVLADGTGTSNEVANAGDHSASGSFVIGSAALTGVKTVSVFSEDGTGCATIPGTPAVGDQYSVPGACVEYVITVENTGSVDATSVVVNDILNDNLEFIAADTSGFTGGSFANPALPAANTDCTGGACEINFEGATVGSGTPGSPTTATVTIRALIQ